MFETFAFAGSARLQHAHAFLTLHNRKCSLLDRCLQAPAPHWRERTGIKRGVSVRRTPRLTTTLPMTALQRQRLWHLMRSWNLCR